MSVYNVTIEYNEPREAVIKVETPDNISSATAEDIALKQFEEKYPDVDMDYVDILEVEEIKE